MASFGNALAGALKGLNVQREAEEAEKSQATQQLLSMLTANPALAEADPSLTQDLDPRLAQAILGMPAADEAERARALAADEAKAEATQMRTKELELSELLGQFGTDPDERELLAEEREGEGAAGIARQLGEFGGYQEKREEEKELQVTLEAERRVRENKPPKSLSKVDLAVLVAQGDPVARQALEYMGREPTATQQQVQPYVEALKRGEMTITGVPAPVRDEVLASAHGQGVRIVSDKERQQIMQLKKVKPIFNSIADLSEKINTGEGVAAKVVGAVEKQKAKINLEMDVAEYNALVSGFTPLVARAVGHTGVLTEQDVQSVKEMFPKPGDSKELRDRKVARLLSIYGSIQAVTEEGILKPVGDGNAPTEDLSGMSTEELLNSLESPE